MRLDEVRVVLRPRTPWEAVELGMALVRRNAGAILRPWCLVTLPVFLVVNAFGWWLDLLGFVPIVLWWLKPVFDRVPLFVISRAVFGDAPDARTTLAAQRTWGWRAMLHHLTWRRLSPLRALYLPVDLLEGAGNGAARRRIVGGGAARGIATVVTLVCANFEFALLVGVLWLVPLFSPPDRFSDAFRFLSWLTSDAPAWAELVLNALYLGAMTVMEPFYVGAGFGLYLNRRTELEAWDVELVFRRLRERLGGGAMALMLVVGGTFAFAPGAQADPLSAAAAVEVKKEKKAGPPTLPRVFGENRASDASFRKAIDTASEDPSYRRKEIRYEWVRRDEPKPGTSTVRVEDESPIHRAIMDFFGALAESAMWLLVLLVLLLLAASRKRWLPWLQGIRTAAPAVSDVEVVALVDAAPLPIDIPAAARALWREGRVRAALALLYRASVAAMVARTGARLVPGATEAECLRAARALQDVEDRDAFNAVVRTWQYAAYADRLPEEATFESQLARMTERFGWAQ